MDLARVGLIIRALRRRRSWRQADLAHAAGVSQTLISLVERGHADRISTHTLTAVAGAVDARVMVELRWRGGDLDRLLDSDHAAIVAEMSDRLRRQGWETRIEVTYATRGGSGSIDILAWYAAIRSLLVIEVKTEITSAEATLRKLDEKTRIAAEVASERFGWRAMAVSRLLVIEGTSTARRRVDRHAGLFDAAVPLHGSALRRWLREPVGAIAGRVFVSPSNGSAGIRRGGGRHRVRRQRTGFSPRAAIVGRASSADSKWSDELLPTILVGYKHREC